MHETRGIKQKTNLMLAFCFYVIFYYLGTKAIKPVILACLMARATLR